MLLPNLIFHHTLHKHKSKHVFLEAENVLNMMAPLFFLLKILWKKMEGNIVTPRFEDVKSVAWKKLQKMERNRELMKPDSDLEEVHKYEQVTRDQITSNSKELCFLELKIQRLKRFSSISAWVYDNLVLF